MRELADGAGVTVPGLYYHFDSKAAIAREVYRARFGADALEVTVRRASARAGTTGHPRLDERRDPTRVDLSSGARATRQRSPAVEQPSPARHAAFTSLPYIGFWETRREERS
jgi:AcrR family transcriptional regulator